MSSNYYLLRGLYALARLAWYKGWSGYAIPPWCCMNHLGHFPNGNAGGCWAISAGRRSVLGRQFCAYCDYRCVTYEYKWTISF